jgi:alpha-N-acetylglucosaminidase
MLKSQVTWGADQLDGFLKVLDQHFNPATSTSIPTLPRVPNDRVAILSTVPWRHGWNMVTFGYTSTFWNWTRWEREIDWMALHGVNLPLAYVGQEYVWIQAFAAYGIQPEEMEQWFAGPAFLPWQRAGNLMGFGGPLPMQWIIDQRDLQRNILKRMRELDMKPVLPCFAGHVPAAAKRAWPHGHFSPSGVWNNFPEQFANVLVIDPTDDAFHDISAAFMEAQQKIYGSDGYYGCDTFNENDPPTDNTDYLMMHLVPLFKESQTRIRTVFG